MSNQQQDTAGTIEGRDKIPTADLAPSPTTSSLQPVDLEPPPQIVRPQRNVFRNVRVGGASYVFSFGRFKKAHACARSCYCENSRRPFIINHDQVQPKRRHLAGEWKKNAEMDREVNDSPYVVAGLMPPFHNVPREKLVTISAPESLFQRVRRAVYEIRPLWRRLFSLKHVAAFGLYQCHPEHGYHTSVTLSRQTELILSDMFLQYASGEPDYGDRWLDWIQTELNNGSTDPSKGKYSLQLLLRWSSTKMVFWGGASILFSLVIGLWYMCRPYPGISPSDYVAIVQTAWTVSSYIVTAAGVAIALLAAITQVGDV